MCARINPVLVLAAIIVALLNLAVAAQRWTVDSRKSCDRFLHASSVSTYPDQGLLQ